MRTKQVVKNDEDQKIKQDGIKPEDKALKVVTKIQAGFRGHSTREKLKGEKKGNAQATQPRRVRRRKMPLLLVAPKRRKERVLLPLRQSQPLAPSRRSPAKQEKLLPRRKRGRASLMLLQSRWPPPRLLSPQRRRLALLRQKAPLQLPLTTRRPPRQKMPQPRRSLNKPLCLLPSLLLLLPPPHLLQRM